MCNNLDIPKTYGVDEYGHLFKDPWDQAVKRHHPVTSKQKITIDIKIATVVCFYLCSKGFHDLWLIEPFGDPSKLAVTERSVFAWNADIVRVLSCSLVGSDDGVVAVNCRWNTGPNTFAVVAGFNKGLTPGECIIHSLALAIFHYSWPTTFAACHRPVVLVLRQAVGQSIADQDRF